MSFIVSLNSCLQLGVSVNCDKWVFISVADPEVGASIAPDLDLLSRAPSSVFLARDHVAVGASGHAGVQSHIQIPEGKDELSLSSLFLLLLNYAEALGNHLQVYSSGTSVERLFNLTRRLSPKCCADD